MIGLYLFPKFKLFIMRTNNRKTFLLSLFKRTEPVSLKALRALKSFTLVELLIVIAILAILAAAVIIVINPSEMMSQARDTERVSSVKSVRDAIDILTVDDPSASLGTSNIVSVSVPDTSPTCANLTGLPILPPGWTYRCVTTANLRNTDSTGWIPINLNAIKGGSPIPLLPIDPVNTVASGRYYMYIRGTSYEIDSSVESAQFREKKTIASDGGDDPYMYETGANLTQLKTELFVNSNWSTGTFSNWSVSAQGSSIIDTPSHYGQKTMVIQGSNSYCNNYVFQDLPVQQNTTYSIGAWIKTVNEPAYAMVAISDPPWANMATSTIRPTGNTDWTYVSVSRNSGSLTTLRFILSVQWCGGASPGNGPSGISYFSTPSAVAGTTLFNK